MNEPADASEGDGGAEELIERAKEERQEVGAAEEGLVRSSEEEG